MTRDHDRIARIRRALETHGLDVVVCGLRANVLMLLSGYWPVIGSALAVATREGGVALIVPADEAELRVERLGRRNPHLRGRLAGPLTTIVEAVGTRSRRRNRTGYCEWRRRDRIRRRRRIRFLRLRIDSIATVRRPNLCSAMCSAAPACATRRIAWRSSGRCSPRASWVGYEPRAPLRKRPMRTRRRQCVSA